MDFTNTSSVFANVLSANDINYGTVRVLIDLDDRDISLADLQRFSSKERDGKWIISVEVRYASYNKGFDVYDMDGCAIVKRDGGWEPLLDDAGEEIDCAFEYQAIRDAVCLLFGSLMAYHFEHLSGALIEPSKTWKIA